MHLLHLGQHLTFRRGADCQVVTVDIPGARPIAIELGQPALLPPCSRQISRPTRHVDALPDGLEGSPWLSDALIQPGKQDWRIGHRISRGLRGEDQRAEPL